MDWLGLAPRPRLNHIHSPCISVGRSSTVLLGGLLCCRLVLRIFSLWLRVNGFLTFDVPTEAVAHGRQHLVPKTMLLPRAETGVERRGNHVCWDRFLNRGFDRPAALTRILDVPGEILQ